MSHFGNAVRTSSFTGDLRPYMPGQGFSLTELLTVLALLGVLATMLVPTVQHAEPRSIEAQLKQSFALIPCAFSNNFLVRELDVINFAR